MIMIVIIIKIYIEDFGGGITDLVLDVDEVLGVGDSLDVRIGDRVFCRVSRRPLAATKEVVISWCTWGHIQGDSPSAELDFDPASAVIFPAIFSLPTVSLTTALLLPAHNVPHSPMKPSRNIAKHVVAFITTAAAAALARADKRVLAGVLDRILLLEDEVPEIPLATHENIDSYISLCKKLLERTIGQRNALEDS